jgi:hypothetical protein
VADWVARVAARPAVARAWALLAEGWPDFQPDERARAILFGASQLDRVPPAGEGSVA